MLEEEDTMEGTSFRVSFALPLCRQEGWKIFSQCQEIREEFYYHLDNGIIRKQYEIHTQERALVTRMRRW